MNARFIPWLFVAGMALVVAVNGTLIYFATTTWSGLSVDRAYERGLAYNQVLAAAARQEALGWQFTVRVASEAAESRVFVEARDRNGRPVEGLRVEAILERPVEAGKGTTLELRPVGIGQYAATLDRLRPGQWQANLVASRGADVAVVSHREILR